LVGTGDPELEMSDHFNAEIARFIAERGVTKCPTAVAAPTTASLSEADVRAHVERGLDPLGDIWRKKKRGGWTAYWRRRGAKGQPA
jgi:hypothetical protein